MEADAEGEVDGRDHQQSPESLQQQRHQAHLEHVGVEHHQQDDDHVEEDANILDAAEKKQVGGPFLLRSLSSTSTQIVSIL